ncbi:MAG: PAS domain S-box protein [Methanolobus sp.]
MIKEHLLEKGYTTSIDKENDLAIAYFIVDDINDRPAIIFKTEMERTIYKEGLATISTTFYLSLIISITFAFLLLALLNKSLISRITSLRNGIKEIDFKADIKSRLKKEGEDEISELADNINSMLDSLQEKNVIFQSTIESVSYGFVAVDMNEQVIFMNPEYLNIFRLAPEIEFEKDGYKLMNTVLQKVENPEEIADKIEKGKFSTEKTKNILRLKDGRILQAYSIPLQVNNKVYGRLYAHNDITEILAREEDLRNEMKRREEVEQELLESEEKFSKIATSAKDAIILVNSNGETTFWNKAASRMFGYSENEVTGKNIHLLIAPDKYTDDYKKRF